MSKAHSCYVADYLIIQSRQYSSGRADIPTKILAGKKKQVNPEEAETD